MDSPTAPLAAEATEATAPEAVVVAILERVYRTPAIGASEDVAWEIDRIQSWPVHRISSLVEALASGGFLRPPTSPDDVWQVTPAGVRALHVLRRDVGVPAVDAVDSVL